MTKNEGTAVATVRSARGFLTKPEVMEQIAMSVAKSIDPDRLIRTALTAMSRNPGLLECSPASWVLALQEAGSLGLEPTGVLGHAYLVPRWNKKTRSKEAQFQIGYQGLRTLARRSKEIRNVTGEVVFEGDEFHYKKGTTPELVHVPVPTDELRKAVFFYAISWWVDGSTDFEVMNRAQVEAIRQRSDAKDSGPWVTDFNEMGRKTVLRLHCKHLPLTAEAQEAIAYDDEVGYGHGMDRVQLGQFVGSGNFEIPEPETSSERAARATSEKVGSLKERFRQAQVGTSPDELGQEIRESVEADLPDFPDDEEDHEAPGDGELPV